tara:strand:+ start:10306 stop:10986 length:681 start_codon:yes stop_codon:yes gene_type:complete
MLVHKKQLNHNKDSFVHQARFLANQIANEIAIPNGLTNTPHPSLCTACSPHYNLFTSTMPEIYYLYKEIQEFFKTEIMSNQGYWIVGWLNYWPNKGEVLDWHGHDYGGGTNCFHGIYGINCEPSYAEYREIGTEDIVERIENKNGQLLITPSTNIEHRISDWNEDEPRITIAFNIQPIDTMLQHIQTPKVNPANKVGLQLHQDNLRMNQPGSFMPGGNPLNYYVPL